MRTRSLSILATTATLAALLGCPIEGLKTPDAASLGAESDSVGGVPNGAGHDDAVDAAEDVSWADEQMPAGKSALRVLMTDAPVEADSVFVTFCGIFAEPAADMGGAPGVAPDSRPDQGTGGYAGRDPGAAGAPAAPSAGGTAGMGAGGAGSAPPPEDDSAAKAEAERAEAERAAGAAGADGAAPSDPEREAAEREAAGTPTDDRAGTDAVDPGMEGGAPREAWRPLNQECQTIDLLTLRNGVTEAIGVATLPPGFYGQIRLILADASIVVDGTEHELRLPPGSMESGLQIRGGFELRDGSATTVTVDFDAGASVQYSEESGYELRPVINIVNVVTHADESGDAPRDPVQPGTDPAREPPRDGAGGAAGAGGAGGDGAGGRPMPPPPPPPPGSEPPRADEPPPPEMPEQPEPPRAGDEPHPEEPPPPPPSGEEPPAEEPPAP